MPVGVPGNPAVPPTSAARRSTGPPGPPPRSARTNSDGWASGASNACTSPAAVSNETSADPSAASFARAAASSGIDTCCAPAATGIASLRATTRPLMSAPHGGTPPSVAAHAVMP